METLILVLQIISCLFLIGLILVQKGQGADIGAAFGGASNTVFGSRGPATFLNKLTIIIAVVFLGSSIYLAHNARYKSMTSVVDETKKIELEKNAVAPEAETKAVGEAVKVEEAEETKEKIDKDLKE